MQAGFLASLHPSSAVVRRVGQPPMMARARTSMLSRGAASAGVSGCSKAPCGVKRSRPSSRRSEEHTSELQSLMRISYAVFCLKKKNTKTYDTQQHSLEITNKQ